MSFTDPIDKEALQKSFNAYIHNSLNGGFQGIWNPFLPPSQSSQQSQQGGQGQVGWDGSKGGKKNKTKTPDKQWTFQPNPYDQSPYMPGLDGSSPQMPIGNAAQYTINVPRQDWMLNPAGSAYDYMNQWAPSY